MPDHRYPPARRAGGLACLDEAAQPPHPFHRTHPAPADGGDTPLERIPFLDERLREDLRADLEARGLPCSAAGLVAEARQRGVNTFAIPFDDITHALAGELRVSQAVADRTLNTIAVTVSCALLHYDQMYLTTALAKLFPGRTQLIEMNVRAAELTYEFVRHNLPTDDFPFRIMPQATTEGRLLINGNQAVALGSRTSPDNWRSSCRSRPDGRATTSCSNTTAAPCPARSCIEPSRAFTRAPASDVSCCATHTSEGRGLFTTQVAAFG